MASMKNIKRRIGSVNNTQKIMKAMNLVAASKLQKARGRLAEVRPMYEGVKDVMESIKKAEKPEGLPFTDKREVKNAAYIVMTSDRGLCGGFNLNVSKEGLAHIKANKKAKEKIIAVGTKGFEYFRRRRKEVVERCMGPSETSVYENAEAIGSKVVSMYLAGEVDEVYIVYTRFETILSHIPRVERLLPLEPAEDDAEPSANEYMTYDPDFAGFIEYATPMYINMSIFGAMMESVVCEQAARMTSMDAATRNAGEILDDLTLEYNRKRQGMITQEITEIVSGANALK
jgi:F-type H+-transporting ATPase subunit gamma